MAFKVELRPHIAQRQHPITKQPMFDEYGNPVSLFPNQRSIFVDGFHVGYVCEPPKRNIAFIRSEQQLGKDLIEQVRQQVLLEFGETPSVSTVPEHPQANDVEDED